MFSFFTTKFGKISILVASLFGGWLIPSSAWALQIVPDCALGSGVPGVDCILEGFVSVAQVILGITGGVALVMFVYGGFLMLSSGGGDRTKKGIETIKAAVIGIVIILLAGYLVRYGLTQLKVNKELLDEVPTAAEEECPEGDVMGESGTCERVIRVIETPEE